MFQDASLSLQDLGVSVESASLLEDVEMTSDQPGEAVQYIAVDTNVFLQRFGLVKVLYAAFNLHANGEVKLLIPFVVINELDGLTSNQSPAPHNPQISISEAARAGTHWLLEASRARTQAIRFQKWSDRNDESLIKGDDRILDCCLHFRQRGDREVVLWTDDRNLALLAEANDIRTVGGSGVTPKSVLGRLPLSLPADLLDYLEKHPIQDSAPTLLRSKVEEDGMELDLDLDDWTPIPIPIHTAIPPPRGSTDLPSQDPSFPFPSKRRTSPSKLSSPLPSPLASSIALAFVPFYNALPLPPTVIRRTWGPESSAFEIIKSVVHALEMLEKDREKEGRELNVDLLKTISAFRVLQAAIDPKVVSRRPRTGEVADALEELRVLVQKLGCPVDQEQVRRLVSEVREL